MKKNDLVEIDIERLGGEMGISHHDGLTLFVKNALPGERVLARAEKVEKSVAFLKTLEVLAPSPERVTPRCPHYDACGGCVCQHMTYALSLDMKRERVRDALRRIGGVEVDVLPVIGMENPWHYRNKTALPVGGAKGNPLIGFYAPRSHRIVEIGGCLIAREEADIFLSVVRAWMTKFSIEPYDERTRTGAIRHILCRVSRAGDVMAVVVSARDSLAHQKELIAMVRAAMPAMKSLCLNINKRGDNVILGDVTRVLYGADRLEDTLLGLTFSISPQSFFQVNPVQTEILYRTALDFAGLTGNDTVLDLYCGAGTISLMLAGHAKRVIGIEIVPQAIENARENAVRNGITNAEFHCAAAEIVLPKLVSSGLRPDVVVLDPPRKGAERAVLSAIADARPEKIVYVSCDPATLSRDVKALTESGYRAVQAQPVDMFCHTAHVETVVLLSR